MGSPCREFARIWGLPSGFRSFPASVLKKPSKKVLKRGPEAAEIHSQPQSQLPHTGVKPSAALAVLCEECD